MAKTLYRKENGELIDTIERYTDGLVYTMQMQEVIQSPSAAKAPKKRHTEKRLQQHFAHKMKSGGKENLSSK